MNEQWIQQLRQIMDGYQRPAPEVSWDEIDKVLSHHKADRTRRLWLHSMAAAALLLLIAGVGYWSFMDHPTEPMLQTTASVEEPSRDVLDEQPVKPADTAPMLSEVRLKTQPQHKIVAKTEAVEDSSVPSSDSITITPTATEEKEQPRTVETKTKTVTPVHQVINPSDHSLRKNIDHRLTAKVYISSTANSLQTTSNHLYGNGILANLGSSQSFSMKDHHIEQHVNHHQPVRFGLSMRYRLNNRWGVESGLQYTHLSSDITTTVDGATMVTEQRLNYIGLPLNISYELWKNRNFDLYVSAGSTIEKRLEASPWQFSLNGAAGAEYKLTDIFSLYAEPGLGYYFNDGSSTPTIYQDRPLNFNLSFGLRFNIE